MKILCEVYKSNKQEELYLYVNKADGLERVPEELLARVDCAKPVMSLLLTAERTLSRADIKKVMAEIQDNGFYLQLPPSIYQNQQL